MEEVRDGVERVMARRLELDVAGLGCPVVLGAADEERPDEFVAVAAEDAEGVGGGVYLMDVRVRVVGLVDVANAKAAAKARVKMIGDYLDDPECVLRGWEDDDVKIFGYTVLGQETEERGTRQFSRSVMLKIGAAAFL